MRRRYQRLTLAATVVGLLALSAALALSGLRDSVVYFYAPGEVAGKAAVGKRVRLGGLVEAGSVVRRPGEVRFVVTDNVASLPVIYHGEPPDLFREGQGVVCEGVWQGEETFVADRVLAKHDERYMPREVAEALKARGEWKGD